MNRFIQSNGVTLQIVEAGHGPLVVLCHGFPGGSFSWGRQFQPLVDAGYRVVAPDLRGYGRSSRPKALAAYDMNQQIADLLGLLDALGETKAIFVGSDFGAALVWNLALRHPEVVAAVVGVSCPFDFDFYGRSCWGHIPVGDLPPQAQQSPFASPVRRPSECFAAIAAFQFFHAHYFQEIGPADEELGGQLPEFLRRIYWALSGAGTLGDWSKFPSEGTGYLDVLPAAPPLPWSWLSAEEFSRMVAAYQPTDVDQPLFGPLASYRVADRNWDIGDAFKHLPISVPSLFVAGALDPVLQMIDSSALERMATRLDQFQGAQLIPDAGHFVQMESAEAFNAVLLEFVSALEA